MQLSDGVALAHSVRLGRVRRESLLDAQYRVR